MKKYLIVSLTVAIAFSGSALAAERPSLRKVLDRRPSLQSILKPTTSNMPFPNIIPVKNTTAPAVQQGVKTGTGTVRKGTVYETPSGTWQEDEILGRQNAEDVKAYREENGYIKRYLSTPTNLEAKKLMAANVEQAIKSLLATQKSMRVTYDAGVKNEKLMTKADWDLQAEGAVVAYKIGLTPYINTTKNAEFDRFIIGRTNLLKGMFDKLETIRQVKTKQ